MILHLLKLIWNRKRSNALMIAEIFFSFLVLFAISSLFINNIYNYIQPRGFSYENVWSLELKQLAPEAENTENETDEGAASVAESSSMNRHEQILQQLKTYPQIEAFSASSNNVPFSFNTWNTNVTRNNHSAMTYMYRTDDRYPKVVDLTLVEGRWFSASDDASRLPPIVINLQLKDQFFPGENAVGQTLSFDGKETTIVGVIDEYRAEGEYNKSIPVIFERIASDESGHITYDNIVIKVKPGTGAAFEEKLLKDLGNIAPGSTLEISALEEMRKAELKITEVPMIALLIICGFLIINVALGLFGVLWYNINRRYSEIGLRRATGATGGKIQYQFVEEVLVLATFGIVIGCFIAAQFPLLNVFNVSTGIYLLAIAISIVLIYSLAVICAWYPGWEAAKIEPAVALHDE